MLNYKILKDQHVHKFFYLKLIVAHKLSHMHIKKKKKKSPHTVIIRKKAADKRRGRKLYKGRVSRLTPQLRADKINRSSLGLG